MILSCKLKYVAFMIEWIWVCAVRLCLLFVLWKMEYIGGGGKVTQRVITYEWIAHAPMQATVWYGG